MKLKIIIFVVLIAAIGGTAFNLTDFFKHNVGPPVPIGKSIPSKVVLYNVSPVKAIGTT